ncbi:MAG TPA: tRNA pseudouridine(13) synthase TruD, partial [Planctomycetota bacterium]|nr:tRNA pseudouridine(13) synthase TruD [Planctomycetota bacterium]
MKLKQRVGDFRVRELLRRDYLAPEGEHRVYRVTKRKLDSEEAARALASEAGVEHGEVRIAGLKDRQGLTIQYMSLARGREVHLQTSELRVEPVGFAHTPLESQ